MWVSKDSVYGNGFSLFLSLHLNGCENISLLKREKIKEKTNSITEWNKFTFISSLAKISKNKNDFLQNLKDLGIQEDNDYVNGGMYFGEGLLSIGQPLQERIEILKENISKKD